VTGQNSSAIEAWVHIARLIRPQGRRGEVLAEILSDFPGRFTGMRNAFLWRGDNGSVTPILLENSWLHKGKIVLKFAQVDSISAAEGLRGAELVIPGAERMNLQPDEVYISDLIGCACVDVSSDAGASSDAGTAGRVLGTIRDVLRQEQTADLLVVVDDDGVEHEIPFAKAYMVNIDVTAQRVEMRLPSGLLEVNGPLSEEERRARNSSADPES
jgi:16S rRNA processing protein RimM